MLLHGTVLSKVIAVVFIIHAVLFKYNSHNFRFPVLGTTSAQVEVEHYDPYSNTWALTCPALKYVTNFTATACFGKLYVIGSCAVKYNALTMQCYNPVIGKVDFSIISLLLDTT